MSMKAKIINKRMCLVTQTDGGPERFNMLIFKDEEMIVSAYCREGSLWYIDFNFNYKEDKKTLRIVKKLLSPYTKFKTKNHELYFYDDLCKWKQVKMNKFLGPYDDYPFT